MPEGLARPLRLLMPHTALSSFIRADIESLESVHQVTLVPCTSLGAIARGVLRAPQGDAVICWFGSTRFLPLVMAARAFGRPVVIISGGYDVASMPALDYGNMYHASSRWLGRALFRLATLVLSISHSAAAEARANAGVDAARLRVLYLGLDPALGADAPSWRDKEPFALTVGHADVSSIRRKGILSFVRAARLLPDVPFVVAGPAQPDARAELQRDAGANVRFEDKVSWERLRDLYARARVYVQPSQHEAFGYSVAEAMLHNCVPVVSRRFSLPEVVGEAGYYVDDPDDVPGLAALIATALECGGRGGGPRDRVVALFSRERRRAALLDIVAEVCHGG